MVRVGIFWVIEGKVWYRHEEKSKEASINGKIDSDLAHFTEWEKSPLKMKYRDGDFATFPRGRVIYDTIAGEHIIYADRCINQRETEKIAVFFCAEKYRLEADEHYRCDRCLKLNK